VGLKGLSPKLREFCELRLKNPEMSLADLGRLCDPPASKSAMYHRVLRLQELVKDANGEK
jgi:DNA-binding protein WhiA